MSSAGKNGSVSSLIVVLAVVSGGWLFSPVVVLTNVSVGIVTDESDWCVAGVARVFGGKVQSFCFRSKGQLTLPISHLSTKSHALMAPRQTAPTRCLSSGQPPRLPSQVSGASLPKRKDKNYLWRTICIARLPRSSRRTTDSSRCHFRWLWTFRRDAVAKRIVVARRQPDAALFAAEHYVARTVATCSRAVLWDIALAHGLPTNRVGRLKRIARARGREPIAKRRRFAIGSGWSAHYHFLLGDFYAHASTTFGRFTIVKWCGQQEARRAVRFARASRTNS